MIDILINGLSILFLFRIALYSIGDPHSIKPIPSSIFFIYSYKLAYKAAKRYNLILELEKYLHQDSLTIEQMNDLKLQIFNIGKKQFTWQMVCGMCAVCTFFWVSLVFILIPNLNSEGLFIFAFINYLNKILLKWI